MLDWLQSIWEWSVARGPIPTSGLALLIFEIGGKLVLKRTIDPEVLPVAIALLLWEPQRRRQERRNRRRAREDLEDDEPDGDGGDGS